MKTKVTIAQLNCNLCEAQDLDVVYDMPVRGNWAYVCEDCRKKYRLHTTMGTKLVKHKDEEPTWNEKYPVFALEMRRVNGRAREMYNHIGARYSNATVLEEAWVLGQEDGLPAQIRYTENNTPITNHLKEMLASGQLR